MRQSDPTKESGRGRLDWLPGYARLIAAGDEEMRSTHLAQAYLALLAERDALRAALQRLVADLETNSEAGAPDYAHEALERHP